MGSRLSSSDSHVDTDFVRMYAIREEDVGRIDFFFRGEGQDRPMARPKVGYPSATVPVSMQVSHPSEEYPVSERSAAIARIAIYTHARRSRKRPRALVKDRTLQMLVADLVAARTAAGMTQHDVAMRMWTTKSAVRASRAAVTRDRPLIRSKNMRWLSVRESRSGCARTANALSTRGCCREPEPWQLLADCGPLTEQTPDNPLTPPAH